MMTIGIDMASEPDRAGLAVRTPAGWEFIDGSPDDFQRIHGFSPFSRMVTRAELEAFDFRTPAHGARVEAALQNLLRAHADRQGPCVTAEEATSTAAQLRAYFSAALRWETLGFDECSRFNSDPLPSERLAKRMGLGPNVQW